MKKLSKNEWVAVVVAISVVGFFFVFGQSVVSFFSNGTSNNSITMAQDQSKLLVQDEVVGTGEAAMVGSQVVVHYTGKFVDGTVFDSSVSRGEPIQFVLGSGQVIKGWDEGLIGMKVGGKRLLQIPPEYAYGDKGVGPIPGGATLIFEVELLKIEK